MTLTEAKLIADKVRSGQPTIYTWKDMTLAIRALERTSKQPKTQRAWDRLDARLNALKEKVGA